MHVKRRSAITPSRWPPLVKTRERPTVDAAVRLFSRLRPVLTAITHREDHTRVVFISLVLAGVMFALSQTVVTPALPAIQRDLHTTAASAAWILTGYLLAASVATPIVGK